MDGLACSGLFNLFIELNFIVELQKLRKMGLPKYFYDEKTSIFFLIRFQPFDCTSVVPLYLKNVFLEARRGTILVFLLVLTRAVRITLMKERQYLKRLVGNS